MSVALFPDPSELEEAAPVPAGKPELAGPVANRLAPGTPASSQAMRQLVSGTSALGLSVILERGAGFLANTLALRFGGLATFGAYSFAISTANNIATYAAAGIGATAARFSGKYQHGTPEYGTFARVLSVVSILSAFVAAVGLWLGATPVARLLGQPHLTGLLHWAALSAAGIVLLECARGFFVGQRRIAALVLLSTVVGAGMLTVLPLAALRHSPIRMIISQGALTVAAVVICLLLARPLSLRAPRGEEQSGNFQSMLREVWSFGLVQLAGLVGSNLAGWWLITLVARADTSMVQMGLFGIASQLRNLVGLAPGLLTEGSYAVMADPAGEEAKTPQHILGFTSFVSCLTGMSLASVGIVLAPWLLRLIYKLSSGTASVTVAIGLTLAVMHMGNAPAAARLSIVSIRASGVINTLWAIFVASAGTLLMLHGGSAAMALTVYLLAHTLSSVLVLAVLARKASLPRGMPSTFVVAAGSTGVLAGFAALRATRPEETLVLTFGMLLVMVGALATLLALGRTYRWLPSRAAMRGLVASLLSAAKAVGRRRAHAG